MPRPVLVGLRGRGALLFGGDRAGVGSIYLCRVLFCSCLSVSLSVLVLDSRLSVGKQFGILPFLGLCWVVTSRGCCESEEGVPLDAPLP